jgi:hypothetical protein
MKKRDKRRRKEDSGIPRIIAFASNFGLNMLKKAETWSGDGTFSVCPEPFYQLYTIHAHIGKASYPSAFIFLPGKKRLHYHEALRLLKVHVEATDISSSLALRRFLIDFEAAMVSEVKSVFGRTVAVSGCHVHMRRNLRRRLQEQKHLQTLALKNVR